eukprot:m.266 g.266  ORF g.266 m.266 type:complete len:71 (+) comp124_c0_seq1:309-521(+)
MMISFIGNNVYELVLLSEKRSFPPYIRKVKQHQTTSLASWLSFIELSHVVSSCSITTWTYNNSRGMDNNT